MQLLSRSLSVTFGNTVCDCSFLYLFWFYLHVYSAFMKGHSHAEDLLSSSTIILSAKAHLFCSTSEVAFHILIRYEAM